jgi:hypothetical protein
MVLTGELYVLPFMAVLSIMTDGHFGLIKKIMKISYSFCDLGNGVGIYYAMT